MRTSAGVLRSCKLTRWVNSTVAPAHERVVLSRRACAWPRVVTAEDKSKKCTDRERIV